MEDLQEDANLYDYLNGDNIRALVSGNYGRKTVEELSDDEMDRFSAILYGK